MSIMKIIGIVLLVLGVGVLVWGAIDLISFNSSTGGQIANKVAGLFGSRTKVVQESLIKIGAGVAGAVVGFFIFKKS